MSQACDKTSRIAREAGIPAGIWHLKVAGACGWRRSPHGLARLDPARSAGLAAIADQYPYLAGATSLDASVPAWAHSGGNDSLLARLRNPVIRARLRAELRAPPQITDRFYRATEGPQGVIVFPFEDSLHYLQGKRLSEIAAQRHRDPIETMFDLIIADHARGGAIYFLMNEADVRAAMQHWWVAVNTDASGVAPDGPFGKDRKSTRLNSSHRCIS